MGAPTTSNRRIGFPSIHGGSLRVIVPPSIVPVPPTPPSIGVSVHRAAVPTVERSPQYYSNSTPRLPTSPLSRRGAAIPVTSHQHGPSPPPPPSPLSTTGKRRGPRKENHRRTPQITRKAYEDVREVFASIDRDKTGCVEMEEFVRSIQLVENSRVRRELLGQCDELFNYLDLNKDGYVTWMEFLHTHFPKVSDQDLIDARNRFDPPTPEALSFEQLMAAPRELSAEDFKDIEELFLLFDVDRVGYVTPDNFTNCVKAYQDLGLKEEEALHLFRQFDLDQDGVLSQLEFMQLMLDTTRHELHLYQQKPRTLRRKAHMSPWRKRLPTATTTIQHALQLLKDSDSLRRPPGMGPATHAWNNL